MTRWPGDSSILSAVGQLMQTVDDTDLKEFIFYFAGRPIAQLSWFSGGTLEWRAYTVDHLGTPIYAADETGTEVWQGGFEPFGADWQADTAAGALENGVFLRLPGQWEDRTWEAATLGLDLYYNVHRWYNSKRTVLPSWISPD